MSIFDFEFSSYPTNQSHTPNKKKAKSKKSAENNNLSPKIN
jgi:hypothetical protein